MYSPKIRGDLINRLYQLKQKKRKPLTEILQEAIEQYLKREEGNQKGVTK